MTALMLFLQPVFAFIFFYWAVEGARAQSLVELIWIIPASVLAVLWGYLYRLHLGTVRMQGQIEQLDRHIAQERSLRLVDFDAEHLS